jgi:predicted ATPase
MDSLSRITIEGFRSIQSATVELRALNVFVGANGAGKSNLIIFLQMINFALSRGFQVFVQDRGPASALLHFGPKVTPVMRGSLEFRSELGLSEYRFSLAHAAGDSLVFTHEEVQFHREGYAQTQAAVPLGPGGHRESGLAELWSDNDATAKFAKGFLNRCRVYQFHDTSLKSWIRQTAKVENSRYLYADGGNLPAFLLDLRQQDLEIYSEIVRTLRLVLPWFDDFILQPAGNPKNPDVLLRWRMTGRPDYVLGPGQLSDGSLRIMALVTLLLQPEDRRPRLMVIDEPELGLHPAAETIIAGLIKAVATTRQVIISTQSATLLDHFVPEDVVVVENENGRSSFMRQSPEHLKAWLDRYTMGQIWQKDVIGGRP